MNKTLAALGVSIGVLGGGAAGFIATAGSPGVGATAGQAMPRATTSGTTDTTVPGAPADEQDDQDGPDSGWITDALAPLVANGTITQAQADAVAAALADAGPMGGPMGHGGPHHGGPGMGGFGGGLFDELGAGLDAVSGVLGMKATDVMAALAKGTSLAELAKQQGVDVQKVIDAITAQVKSHLDAEVASGEHTQAEADELLASLTGRITDLVNGKLPSFGPMGPMGGPGGRHHGGDDQDDDDADSGAPTTTVG